MNQNPVDATSEKLYQEFNTVVTETEELIKSVAGAGSDRAAEMKASMEQRLASAGERLAKIRQDAVSQARAAACATDEYVKENPWRSVRIVAALAGAAGLIVGLLVARR